MERFGENLNEGKTLPCVEACTQRQILELAAMRGVRTIMVRDPYGACSDLLKNSIDAYYIPLVFNHLAKVVKNKSYVRDTVVIDVRRLPSRPINPWKKLYKALFLFTYVTRSTVILYTNDISKKYGWIKIDKIDVLCVGEPT